MELVKQDYVAVPAVVITGTEQLKGTKDRLRRAALARIALGYQELSLAVGETRSRLTIQDVEEGLRQADVQIFDNKDVSQYKSTTWYRWSKVHISEYEKPIPEFAIDTALRVKRAIPEAEFSIEFMSAVPKSDPFMSFKVPGVQRRFVVEVWDEPDFTAERQDLA